MYSLELNALLSICNFCSRRRSQLLEILFLNPTRDLLNRFVPRGPYVFLCITVISYKQSYVQSLTFNIKFHHEILYIHLKVSLSKLSSRQFYQK